MGRRRRCSRDNGKQFTDRFGRGGEVLFDKICRRNGIAHRLTAPSSPTTTGKIERFHQTLRRELLDDARPFTSLLEAQAALDDWVREYNAERPHQALETARAGHAGRALPARAGRAARAAAAVAARRAGRRPGAGEPRRPPSARSTPARRRQAVDGGPVEFDRVVPPSGNLWAMRRQFWLGPQRAGQTVRFWAGVDVIHLSIAGARVKSLRSHLSIADLAQLAQRGRGRGRSAAAAAGRGRGGDRGRPRGQQQRPRLASAGRQVLAAEILGGRPVIVRIEPQTLMFLDPDTRELLRVRPNPLTPEQALRLQGARPAGPPPRPRTEPVTVQRARQRHRRDHRLPPTRLARPRPRRPHRHRPRLRAHARDRARRRNPHRPPHHQPARRRRQGQPAAPSPGNVNRTLGQRGTGNGASPTDQEHEPQNPYET